MKEIRENIKKAAMSDITMVAPTGVPQMIEKIMPKRAQTTDTQTEQTVTERKLRNSFIAQSAGKIIRAETRSDPTRFIARTMMTAVITEISRL